jgi:cyclophilin family peptidyl-prolyl cis-trans isomerase/Flp pilus assembly protein TadD
VTALLAILLLGQSALMREKLEKLQKADGEFYSIRSRVDTLRARIADARAKGDRTELERIDQELKPLLAQANETAKSIQLLYEQILSIAGGDPGTLDAQSRACELVNDGPRLLPIVERLLKLQPDTPRFRVRHACALRLHNRYEEAREEAAVALKADAADPRTLAESGLVAYALDDYETAAPALEEAARKPDGFGTALRREVERLAKAARPRIEHRRTELARRKRDAENPSPLPQVKLVTSKGEIVLELFEDDAPNTVANFVSLVDAKFYDRVKFHRVIPDFMAQGGCPNTRDDDPRNDGQGGPGYAIKDEVDEAKFRRHFRGSLSMANAGPDTGGSQFFITHRPTEYLDGKHTVFGRVVSGQDVADKLAVGDELISAAVLRRRDHPYKPVTEKR